MPKNLGNWIGKRTTFVVGNNSYDGEVVEIPRLTDPKYQHKGREYEFRPYNGTKSILRAFAYKIQIFSRIAML